MADEEKTFPKRPDQSRLKVTKEELDASGLSLRDYMNKQLGLKRRDGSASAPTKAAAPTAKASSNDWDDNSTPIKDTTPASAPAKKENQGSMPIGETDYAKTVRARGDFAGVKNMLADRQARIARDNAALESGYKKGGSVSSRADGIAQRGKTRGKMC